MQLKDACCMIAAPGALIVLFEIWRTEIHATHTLSIILVHSLSIPQLLSALIDLIQWSVVRCCFADPKCIQVLCFSRNQSGWYPCLSHPSRLAFPVLPLSFWFPFCANHHALVVTCKNCVKSYKLLVTRLWCWYLEWMCVRLWWWCFWYVWNWWCCFWLLNAEGLADQVE